MNVNLPEPGQTVQEANLELTQPGDSVDDVDRLTGRPGSAIGAAILEAASELPDEIRTAERTAVRAPEPKTSYSYDEAVQVGRDAIEANNALLAHRVAQGLEQQREQAAYAAGLEQGLDADYLFDLDYSDYPDTELEVANTLDEAFGTVTEPQFGRIVEKAGELDPDAVQGWFESKASELAQAEAFIEAQRQAAYADHVQALQNVYAETLEDVARKHGESPEALASRLAPLAGTLRDEKDLREAAEFAAGHPKAQAAADEANVIRAGIIAEAPASDKRNWEREGFASLRNARATTPDFVRLLEQSQAAASPEAARQLVRNEIMGAAKELAPSNRQGEGVQWQPQRYDAHGRPLPRETRQTSLESLIGPRRTAREGEALREQVGRQRFVR